MTSNHDDIIRRVQKLLALATSPNENEAKAAATAAYNLLAKHNLSIEDVEESKIMEEYEALEKDEGKSACPAEDKYIYSLLQKFFFVKIVTSKSYCTAGFKRRRAYKFTLVGRKHNVQIAIYIYDFLNLSFRRAFADFCKGQGTTASKQSVKVRKSYYYGLYMGLGDQLEAAQQKSLAGQQALIVKSDPNIDKFIEQNMGQLAHAKQKPDTVNRDVAAHGYATGKKMQIVAGITGSTESQKQVGQILTLEYKE